MSNNGGGKFHRHGDVLNVTPENDEKRDTLVAEIKARGNDAFKRKSFEEAEVLYTRIVELTPTAHTIFGNRSAARCSMGKLNLALQDAIDAISIDPSWAKGWFRKGQALVQLKKYGQAYVAFEKCVQLEPTNKGAKTQMESAKQKAADAGQELTDKEVVKKEPTTAATTTTSTAPLKTPSVAAKDKKDTKVVETISDSKDLGNVRGYKKTADGRVTTFFNNEMTEEVKELIGDIAPKKIDDAAAVKIQQVSGGSAWNQGSTFEERNMTKWAKDRLTELLVGVNVADKSTVISVKKISEITGDASIAVSRGKKRFLFDFQFELSCSGDFDGDVADGKLKFLDVSSDCDDDYDDRVEVAVKSRYDTSSGKMLYRHLSSRDTGLRQAIVEKLTLFRMEYHTM